MTLHRLFLCRGDKIRRSTGERDVWKFVSSYAELRGILEWFMEEEIPNMHFYNEKESMQVFFLKEEDITAFKLRWL